MRIEKIAITPYSTPLNRPMRWGNRLHHNREGLLLDFIDEKGVVSRSEISPLPTYSKESLAEAKEQMARLRLPLKQTNFTRENWQTELQKIFLKEQVNPFPSVLFGVETALHSMFHPHDPSPPVVMQGLLLGSKEEIHSNIERVKGMRAVKLKVSALSGVKEAVETTREVLEELGPDTALRVDLNRCWSYQEAIAFGKAFYPNTFEYIEEPVREIDRLGAFHKSTGHRIALDDTLREMPIFEALALPHVHAFVLKPTLQGGMHFTLGLAKMAKNRGIDTVLSSSLETEVGLEHIVKMVAKMPDPEFPMGLDTRFLFADAVAQSAT